MHPELRASRVWLVLLLVAVGCGADPSDPDAAIDAAIDAGTPPPSSLGPAERPAELYVPPAHDGATALPLVVLLHGYTVDASVQDLYFGLTRHARSAGLYVLLPDGTIDAEGEPHWDVLGAVVDDHAYLRGLIEEARAALPIDDVFVLGHSNGAFMAYRLACDSADLVSGIASLAGSEAQHPCAPSRPVAVLQIHGTVDDTVSYDGGSIAGLDYPGARELVARWAARSGCGADPEIGAPLDLARDVDGPETEALSYVGCSAGTALWSMVGANHIPAPTAELTPGVVAWLRAHGR